MEYLGTVFLLYRATILAGAEFAQDAKPRGNQLPVPAGKGRPRRTAGIEPSAFFEL